MAGVLGQLFRPQKKAMYRDPKAMELETAKEILAEVFRVKLLEVDEMIQTVLKSLAMRMFAAKSCGRRNFSLGE